MYVAYFQLKEPPFKSIANPRFLWLSDQHTEARAKILYYLEDSAGPIYLISPIGTGKTSIAKDLENELEADDKNHVVRVDAPRLSTTNAFLRLVMDQFEVKTHRAYVDSLESFKAWLVDQAAEGKSPMLLVDEAQNMTRDMLLLVQHLYNFSTDERFLIQMALFTQPELQPKIDRLPSLKSRLAVARLRPLAEPETTRTMLWERWRTAGGTKAAFPFSNKETVAEIHRLTGGVPRFIVRLADETLKKTMAAGRKVAGRIHVIEGHAEMTAEEHETQSKNQV